MASYYRQRALSTLFGSGITGFLGARGVGWLIDEVRSINDPEPLDLQKLRLGDVYTVTVRPRPSAAERRLKAVRDQEETAYRRLIHPKGRARRVGIKLAAAEAEVANLEGRRRPFSTRRRRAAQRRAATLRKRFDALTPNAATIAASHAACEQAQEALDVERRRAFDAARARRAASRRLRRTVNVDA